MFCGYILSVPLVTNEVNSYAKDWLSDVTVSVSPPLSESLWSMAFAKSRTDVASAGS